MTPRPLIDTVMRSICGHDIQRLLPLAGGGMSEAYRADLTSGTVVVLRIARQGVPWFVDESVFMAQARVAGVPTAQVFGVEHHDHDGDLLSFSVQEFLPGRSLHDLIAELGTDRLERLLMDAGEMLARVHALTPADGRGVRHELRRPDDRDVDRIARAVGAMVGSDAARVVQHGAELLRQEIDTREPPPMSLAQGDFMPKNLLVHDGAISGVIDWEFAGPAPAAFDLARWEVSAGPAVHDRMDLLRRGYARITDPDRAAAGFTAAYAIDWALEMLGWTHPATRGQITRAIDVMARYLERTGQS